MNEFPLDLLLGGWKYESPTFSPDGRYLAYIAKAKGNQALFVYDQTSGIDHQLTDGFKIKVGLEYGGMAIGWTADSKGLIVSSDGTLHYLPVKGGEPQEIKTIGKAINPKANHGLLVYPVQDGNSMKLVKQNYSGTEFDWPTKVDYQADFIYNPQIHPIEPYVVIHSWDFPNMSWNESEIVLIHLDTDEVTSVIGGNDHSVSQPLFSPDGKYLSYVSEATGWANLWIAEWNGDNARILLDEEVEHSSVIWISGQQNYIWADATTIVFTRNLQGIYELAVIDIESNEMEKLPLPKGNFGPLTSDGMGTVCVEFSNYKTPNQLLRFNVGSIKEDSNSVFKNGGLLVGQFAETFVKPEILKFKDESGNPLSGLYYTPSESDDNPPLLMLIHGGPTSQFYDRFRYEVHYFINRGWAVFGLNYRGSTGAGRENREQLNGNWGIYDVEDAASAVKYLTTSGYADADKTAIMGGSAGGLTVLMTLAKHPGLFKAGVDLYGVADLYTLSQETHYLESSYIDILVGPLPQNMQKYIDQSPTSHADKIKDPLLILQGGEDTAVPKSQSETIKDKVQGKVEYKIYEGEGHGFRKLETLKDMYPRIQKFLTEHVLL